jgi:phospholipase A1
MIYRGLLEVNYEPELIQNFPLNLILVLIPEWFLALNHESNGKVILIREVGIGLFSTFEYNHLTIYVRPWLILPAAKNDNPDIAEFIGRGDLNIIYTKREYRFVYWNP